QGGTLAVSYMSVTGTLTANAGAFLTSSSPGGGFIDGSQGTIQFSGATLTGNLRFAPGSQFKATNVDIQGTAFFEDPQIPGATPHQVTGQVVRVDPGGTFLG